MIIHRRKKPTKGKEASSSETSINSSIRTSLEENVKLFKNIFKDDETVVYRFFENQKNSSLKCCIIFIDGMINDEIVNENIILPIISNGTIEEGSENLNGLKNNVIFSNNITEGSDIDTLVEGIINGDTVLLLDGEAIGLVISSKGWKTRAIEEPESEKILKGPREGFGESMVVNLTMVRRKLKTPDLKFKFKTLGVRTRTKICLCYIEGIANEKILNELIKRLDDIDIDGVLDTGYIQELIRDNPLSPFRTLGTTERPDVIAGKILEGRIALIMDGTPIALTVPYVFVEYFQSPDDYYNNFYFTSVSRMIRIVSVIISGCIPSLYLVLITFHQEIVPTNLLLSVATAKQGTPFPTVIEAFGLLLTFEILREAGTRMPAYIGQALSIVGALVLGQAAVEARIVSAPMVIIVGLAGITGLMVHKIKGAVILTRIFLLFLGSLLGIFGIVFGVTMILIHLFNTRSFGVGYMDEFNTLNFQDIKDTAVRVPWFLMNNRPRFAPMNNKKRQSEGDKQK